MSYSYNSMGNPYGGMPTAGAPNVAPTQPPAPFAELQYTFVVMFIALVVLAIPAIWLFVPALYTQVTGNQTQGIEKIVADCGDDDGSEDYQALVLFVDDQGQLHEIPANNTCTNFYTDGASVPVSYLANDPAYTYVYNGVSAFFYILGLLWLALFVSALIFFARTTWRLLKAITQLDGFGRLVAPAMICLAALVPLMVAVLIFPPGQPNASGRNYRPGETVAVDGRWSVTVQGGHPVQADSSSPPQDGYVCVELDITLRNIANQSLSLDENQFTLYDKQEQTIDNTCSIRATTLNTSSLAAGDTFQGGIAYQVPIGATQFYLAFQPDPDNALSMARSFWQIYVTQGASTTVYTA